VYVNTAFDLENGSWEIVEWNYIRLNVTIICHALDRIYLAGAQVGIESGKQHRLDSVPVMLKQCAIIILTFKIEEVFDKLTSFELIKLHIYQPL